MVEDTNKSLEGVILGIGNPLLDISLNVDDEYLSKYGLSRGQFLFAEQKHMEMFSELVNSADVEYIAGGACQNSIRAAQWILNTPKCTAYIGAIGKDDNAKTIRKAVESDGVTPFYYEDDKELTGVCGVLISDKERCLVAHIGAANNYRSDHLKNSEVNQALSKARAIYATSFFLTVSPESLVIIGEKIIRERKEGMEKTFFFNLAAPGIIENFSEQMMSVMPYVDVLFGNENEAISFGKFHKLGENIPEIMEKICKLPKIDESRKRIVIITQGKDDTLVFAEGKLAKFPTLAIESSKIVDTNGAGDSFVGGFIAEFVKWGYNLEKCVAGGQYAALQCIQTSGCKFVGIPDL